MPAYFLIRIPKNRQKERLEKMGNLYLHPNYVYLTRGMQYGQIVAIGEKAQMQLQEANCGDILLFHHFVESHEKSQCVDSDEIYNYYVVTALSHNGQNNQTYGIWQNDTIIPHPEYLFLEAEKPLDLIQTPDEYIEKALKATESGIFLFKEWRIDRAALTSQMEEIKAQIESLSKTKMTAPVIKAIEEKEAEMNRISKIINSKKYQLYNLVAAHSSFTDEVEACFNTTLLPGHPIYMLDIACQTKMEFNNTEYIVAKSVHFGIPQAWTKQFNTIQA